MCVCVCVCACACVCVCLFNEYETLRGGGLNRANSSFFSYRITEALYWGMQQEKKEKSYLISEYL